VYSGTFSASFSGTDNPVDALLHKLSRKLSKRRRRDCSQPGMKPPAGEAGEAECRVSIPKVPQSRQGRLNAAE
jgi:hypothetical protein